MKRGTNVLFGVEPVLILTIAIIVLFIIMSSFGSLWRTNHQKWQYVSLENILLFLMIYITIIIGFGLLYTILEDYGYLLLKENGVYIVGGFIDKLQSGLYFSAITILSVGYGDIIPIGAGRWLAVIEALIGYTIPAAFVVRTVIDIEKK